MRLLLLTVSFWALASARPETYKEKEDFQFSRSSSDDGSKSGYYGAQRGNMGGNYEKAHNMDSLAQHQMSTLVRQVDGELGEAANTRTGSVFTSGNSRGIYGSGNYDLSNLKGRNFEEGTSYDNLYASSLLSQNSRNQANSYAANNNARYSSNQLQTSGVSDGYQSGSHISQYAIADNQQAENQYSGSNSYEYGKLGASQYKYYTYGGSHAINEYDQSNAHLQSGIYYNANVRPKLVSASPVRVYVRPGTRVTIPVAAQTYDASQSAITNDHNIVSTDADALLLNNAKINIIKPLSAPKHYESSYSYHKEWEKHDSKPVAIIPTENPFPEHSELHEDAQTSEEAGQQYQSKADSINVLTSNSNKAQSSNLNRAYSSGYGSNTNSVASNRLRYLSQTQNLAAVDAASKAYNVDTQTSGASSQLNSNLNVLDLNSKPKSYQSSYSYHKAWERHGDPYVIKPVGSDLSTIPIIPTKNPFLDNSELYEVPQLSEVTGQHHQSEVDSANVLTSNINHAQSSNLNSAFSSGYSANVKSATSNRLRSQMQNSAAMSAASNAYKVDSQRTGASSNLNSNLNVLDLNSKPKSYQSSYSYHKSWERHGDPYVIKPAGNDLSNQMSQRLIADSTNQDVHSYSQYGSQYNQHSHSQDDCIEVGQRKKRSYSMDSPAYPNSQTELDQQSIYGWNDLGQESERLTLQDLPRQYTQNSEGFGHQTQKLWGNTEGQETQNSWGDLGSFNHHQSQIGRLEDLGQQTQNTWENLDSMSQQIQTGKLEDLGQQTQNTWDNLDSMGQQIQTGKLEDLGQHTQNTWDNLDIMGQQIQTGKLEDLGQQTQNTWDNLDSMSQQIQTGKLEDLSQQTQNTWDNLDSMGQQIQTGKLEDLGQQTQNTWDNLDSMGQQIQTGKLEDLGQQTQNTWDNLDSMGQQIQTGKLEDLSQQIQSGKLEDLGQQIQTGKLEDLGQQIQTGELEDLGQQIQTGKLEDLGQQTQNTWDNLDSMGQQIQTGKLEDLSQQIQSGKLEDLGQQIQTGKLEDLGQQIQTGKLEDLGQQIQTGKLEELGQQRHFTWDQLGNMDQQIQSGKLEDLGQQTQNTWDHLDNMGQQIQTGNLEDLGQQVQNTWDQFENLGQQTRSDNLHDDISQGKRKLEVQQHNGWENFSHENQNIATQEYLNFWNTINIHKQTQSNLNQVNIQASNEQIFHQQNFDSWPHYSQAFTPNSDISTFHQTTNGKESTLWDAVDKIIEESEKKEKNADSKATSNNDNHKISNTNYMHNMETTIENGKTMITQPDKNNQNLFENEETENQNIGFSDIGRGDIGPEDIPTVSLENHNKINEHSHSIAKVFTDNNIENKQENPIILEVIGLEKQDLISSSTGKSKLQPIPNQYTPRKYEDEQMPDVKFNNNFFKHDQELSKIEQQNIHEKFDQVHIEETTKWSHQYRENPRSQTYENIETKTYVNNEGVQPVEVTTAKPGFWKTVWGKTASAKDKIVSWFKN